MSDQQMDDLLRRRMAAPVPRLSPGFHRALAQELRRKTDAPGRFGRAILAGYGVAAALVSVVLMRGEGLGWGAICLMTLGPLAALELARRVTLRQ